MARICDIIDKRIDNLVGDLGDSEYILVLGFSIEYFLDDTLISGLVVEVGKHFTI